MSEKLTLIPFELRLRSHGQNYNFSKENYISAGAENKGKRMKTIFRGWDFK